jgi:SAM-dependent methyltransferase
VVTLLETPRSTGTSAGDYAAEYYASYAGHGDYDWATQAWRDFFLQAAGRVKALTNARTVLDVGCAKGLLVQALAGLGVDAHGIDVSEHAISRAHEDVRDRLRVASATDPIDGRYDLITCIEVLEHMSPVDAQVAIDNMCAASDLILFTSTPGHFDDPTHVNVRPTADWVASFAERGFFRRTDVSLDFLATWGVLVQKADLSPRDLVHRYEAEYATLHAEVVEKRTALLEAHREIARLHGGEGGPAEVKRLQKELARHEKTTRDMQAEMVAAQSDLLTTRDHIIGLEAKTEELARRLVVHKQRLTKQQERASELQKKLHTQRRRAEENQHRADESRRRVDELLASRTWRLGRMLTRPFRSTR